MNPSSIDLYECALLTVWLSAVDSVVGQLANDSGNIVDLVREQYDSLIKTVKLTSSYSGADINVTISASNCGE